MSSQARSASRQSRELLLVPLALCALLASVARADEPAKKSGPAPGSFTIEKFQLESGVTLPKAVVVYGTYGSLNAADANNLILQMRTWQSHDGGTTPGFDASTEKALRSVSAPVLYMPSETDLYFPLGDAKQESRWIRKVTLAPIPSLWGHPAGAGVSSEDLAFIERKLRAFLATR
jgi:homoserine acetyltransferase